jgi:translocation protein SEC63
MPHSKVCLLSAMSHTYVFYLIHAQLSVIGERIVTPSSIVFLVVKLRLSPPFGSAIQKELDAEETKQNIKINEEKDEEFLAGRKEMEDISSDGTVSGWAHAPYWPGVCYYLVAAKPR